MRTKPLFFAMFFMSGMVCVQALCAEEPIIPPSISKISPAGMERGTTATFSVEGRNLSDAREVIFDVPGVTGKLTEITDVPEKITGPRAGEDLGAQVPLGKKQTAQLEVMVAKDVAAGIHRFRVRTPLGTTNMVVIDIGSLPEVTASKPMVSGSAAQPQKVQLPATFVGTIASPGSVDRYEFEGKAGEEIVFQVEASQLGSRLQSKLVLSDASGATLTEAGKYDDDPDAELHYKLPKEGLYTLSISDREQSGGTDRFYRLNAGPLPYITSVFPLGVRAGEETEVSVEGVNLGDTHKVKVEAPKSADGWTTIPLAFKNGATVSMNAVKLAVGNEPEVLEKEPNNTTAQAQVISLPATINGRIAGGNEAGGKADEDYFRFRARKGERLNIDVAASRLGSSLDSVVEVLDAEGNAIPRATIRCLNETTTTLSDKDSRTTGIRLVSTSGLHEGDYLMVGDELNRLRFIPDQPDADSTLEGMEDLRVAYLGTSPDVHAVNTPVYKAQILPSDAEFPANGLPVFHLTWRNDDGGPGYGADSKLDFVAPADGEYLLHLKDVRGMEGRDFAYRLTIRDATPDYQLSADPENPNIPRGGSVPVTVAITQIRNYEGPIQVEVKGLPLGITATPATIPPGQKSTVVVLSAASDASLDEHPAPIEFVGHANVDGHDLIRLANKDADSDPQLQLASVIPPPDVVVTTEAKEVAIEPGKEVTVTLHVERQNGFKGRVPCSVENLPPGVEVVNVGLNGVLVTEAQTSRTFTLRAEEWAKPIDQPIYVVGQVESNSPTMHPSAPLLLKVFASKQTASVSQDQSASPNR
ncbi:MAG TPA: hypothetical protein VKH40_07625 [Alloacidobacterium sp.]|nr:hypothetical protein [Alloacidobacterium sp.]